MFLQEAELRLLLARRSVGCRKAGVSIPSPGVPNWDEASPGLTWESPWGDFLSHPGMCFLWEEAHSLLLEGFPFLGTSHLPP